MPQLDSDPFTYSNGNLATASSAKWTKLSGFTDLVVTSNQVGGTAAVDSGDVITSWSGSAADHYSQVAIATLVNDGGPTIRSDSANNFYLIDILDSGGNVNVYKCVGGTFTAINFVNITFAGGDTVYLEAQGTTIISKQNGTTRHNFSDGSIASGKPGIFISNSGLVLDTWAAGDFGGAAAQVPYQPNYLLAPMLAQ